MRCAVLSILSLVAISLWTGPRADASDRKAFFRIKPGSVKGSYYLTPLVSPIIYVVQVEGDSPSETELQKCDIQYRLFQPETHDGEQYQRIQTTITCGKRKFVMVTVINEEQ